MIQAECRRVYSDIAVSNWAVIEELGQFADLESAIDAVETYQTYPSAGRHRLEKVGFGKSYQFEGVNSWQVQFVEVFENAKELDFKISLDGLKLL